MCDPSPVRNWLFAVLAAVIGAIGFIGVAIATNGSFWLAWQSPGWMLAAAGSTGLAVVFCGFAVAALDRYCTCVGEHCSGACANLRNTINAARVVLGIQAMSCLAAALIAWIPGIGQPPMYAIAGALFLQVVLLVAAIAFYKNLVACAPAAGPASQRFA
jgi:hypothetical protein